MKKHGTDEMTYFDICSIYYTTSNIGEELRSVHTWQLLTKDSSKPLSGSNVCKMK